MGRLNTCVCLCKKMITRIFSGNVRQNRGSFWLFVSNIIFAYFSTDHSVRFNEYYYVTFGSVLKIVQRYKLVFGQKKTTCYCYHFCLLSIPFVMKFYQSVRLKCQSCVQILPSYLTFVQRQYCTCLCKTIIHVCLTVYLVFV